MTARASNLATVVINGQRYSNWTSVSVERSVDEWCSLATFEVVEKGDAEVGWASLRLKPGDKAEVYLAGRKVVDGWVIKRRPSFNAQQHGIQIVVASKIVDIISSSVELKPGEFRMHTFSQIAKSVLKPFGVDISFPKGIPDGADKIFPKVNAGFGETVFAFVERLSRMRNLYIGDDEHGNLIATRATGQEPVVAELQEGRNIKSASGEISDDGIFARIQASAQRPGSDAVVADDARDVSASASNPAKSRYSYGSTYLEEPGDKDDARMRADREMAECMATAVDVSVTVQGWQMDDGSLWIEHVRDQVAIYSPMLFPQKAVHLCIRGVIHRQGNPPIGTETEIALCMSAALGEKPRPNIGAVPNLLDPGNTSAVPDGMDSADSDVG